MKNCNRASARALALAAAAGLVGVASSSAFGQASNVNGTFIPTSGTNSWNVGTNWDTNPAYPNAVGAGATITGGQTINLNEDVTLGSLSLTNDTATMDVIALGTGTKLTFDNTDSNGVTVTMAGTTTTQARLSS